MAAGLCLSHTREVLAQSFDRNRPLFPQTRPQPTGPKEDVNPQGQFLLRADEVIYDRNNEIVTASGNVELSQGNRVLLADTISYNRRTDVVTASGNLSLMEPTGEVLFGNYAEIRDNMKNGFVENIRVLLTDNSRIAAVAGERVNDNKKVFTKAVFSPCEACAKDPTRPPMWQLKAAKITHDEVDHTIQYRDATMEIFGVPVAYSPYFEHPDAESKRSSGFLMPSIGQSTSMGTYVGIPYYAILDKSSDLTIEPRYFQKHDEGYIGGEYRQAYDSGKLRVAGSLARSRPAGENNPSDAYSGRGNISAEGRWDINDTYRTGFDVARATDRTYLRRFQIGSKYGPLGRYQLPNQLTSNAYLEGFDDRNYLGVNAFAFQSLIATDKSEQIAKVLPSVTYSTFGPTDRLGGHMRFDTAALSILRDSGADSQRVTVLPAYVLPVKTESGHLFNFQATLQTSAYNVSDQQIGLGPQRYDTTMARVFPQVAASWQYPMVSRADGYSFLITPMVQGVAGPNGGNSSKIPNEDSRGFDLTDTNLFSPRRFNGYDRLATGQRVDYGLSGGIYGANGAGSDGFIGQSFSSQDSGVYPTGSGLDRRLSDYVGRFSIRPLQYYDVSYRFRVDSENLQAHRQELSAGYYRDGNMLRVTYLEMDQVNSELLYNRPRSLVTSGAIKLDDNWRLFSNAYYDFQRQSFTRVEGGAMYVDECYAMYFFAGRDNFSDNDLRPSTTFLVRIGFKYLGDIRS